MTWALFPRLHHMRFLTVSAFSLSWLPHALAGTLRPPVLKATAVLLLQGHLKPWNFF